MFSSNRYYFIDSLTVRSIVDGSSGQIVDVEPMASIPGETTADRAARMLRQDQRCAALNHEDYELRRQPSGLLAARTGQ